MTFKFYRYLVVNFPVWFLLIIPSVIFMYAASVDQINLEWELKFGECQLLHISELPDSDAGVVPDTFAMRFSRV